VKERWERDGLRLKVDSSLTTDSMEWEVFDAMSRVHGVDGPIQWGSVAACGRACTDTDWGRMSETGFLVPVIG